MTMVGSRSKSSRSRKGAKAAAFGPSPKYSTQPVESTITSSEAFGVVTVIVFPADAFCHSAQLFDGARGLYTDMFRDLMRRLRPVLAAVDRPLLTVSVKATAVAR